MDIIKVASGLACSCLLFLLVLLVFMKNPEKALFEKTVETLMTQEGLSSSHEVLNHVPKLQEINLKMERIGHLNRNINILTAGPAPNLSGKEKQQLQEYSEELFQLRRGVKLELTQLMKRYSEKRP